MDGQLFKVARFGLLCLCLAAKGVLPAAAQEYEGWTSQQFADLIARAQQLPTIEEKLLRTNELLTQYALDQVWAISGSQGAREQAKPQIRFHNSDLPIHVDGNTLSVPDGFYQQMGLLARLVGHDAAVSEGENIPVPSPLLFKPYVKGRLLGLLPNLGAMFEHDSSTVMNGLSRMAACGPQALGCAKAQGIALLCGTVFFVGHEVTHIRQRHKARTGGAYPISEELLADAGGQQMLQKYVRNLESLGELAKGVDKNACLGMPVAFFEATSRRSLGSQSTANYLLRKKAIIESLGSSKDDIKSLTYLQTEKSGAGRIAVSWSSVPSVVVVDGISVSAAEVGRFVLLKGIHKLVAASSSGIAGLDFRVNHKGITRLFVDLKPFRQVSSTELSILVAREQWGDVLAATSNAELRPRDTGVSTSHWEALSGLSMGTWIDPRDMAQVGRSESRNARVLRSMDEPLTSWDRRLLDSID